ncbi:MAG: leucyl aminopeptidase family protein, partial [Rhizobiales bacterium]|nr:leucyl aminopeptidase family protein [Hyphomicrobiales bacterium]
MSSYRYIDRPSVLTEKSAASRPVHAVTAADLEDGTIDAAALAWARATGFAADAGSLLLVPGADGTLAAALFSLGSEPDAALSAGKLSKLLPAGDWHV